jgi:hypothetical protein
MKGILAALVAVLLALAGCDFSKCTRCGGSGKLDCSQCEGGQMDCSSCVGGNSGGAPCRFCRSTGTLPCQFCKAKGANTCFTCGGSGKR